MSATDPGGDGVRDPRWRDKLGPMDHCAECGFDHGTLPIGDVASTLRAATERLVENLVSGDDAAVHTRPDQSTWSVIEYGCHVRDVLLVQRERILLALVENTPGFASMHPDARVVYAHYDRESALEVGQELAVAANLAAKVIGRLSPEQLDRRCIFSFPEPTERDLAWVVRHTVHEVVHHELDVRSVRTRLIDADMWG
jgi:DNA segregation ATPase FtsK/SpoIIIE, S-DNA-T family